jgi:hypothetical protein
MLRIQRSANGQVVFTLRFQEIQDVVRTNQVVDQLIRARKDAFRSYQALSAMPELAVRSRGRMTNPIGASSAPASPGSKRLARC